jgi:dTDP-4-dehydrorhamnose reductase
MHKILILGGSGLVGRAVYHEFKANKNYELYTTYFSNPIDMENSFKMDIGDTENFIDLLDSVKPDIVISCLRGDFLQQLKLHIVTAEYLRENNGLLYFCSTTNVFDNDLSRSHFEDDTPDSQTDYGQYKAECEKRLTEILQNNAIILRLPQIWGRNCPRLDKLLHSLDNNENITVYPKLFLNTITDEMIAGKMSYIIEHNMRGIFHLVAEDVINYKEFYLNLIMALGYTKANIKEDFDEAGYFSLLSKRSGEFTEDLIYTNKMVIKAITKK